MECAEYKIMKEPVTGDKVKLIYMHRIGKIVDVDPRNGGCLIVWEGLEPDVSGPYNLHELEFLKE